jgi:hypothetical protein
MSAPELTERPIDTYGRRISQAHALAMLMSSDEAYVALTEMHKEVYMGCAWLLQQTLEEAIGAMEAHRASTGH